MRINLTDLDCLMIEHTARVERTNRDGWMRETATITGSTRGASLASVGAPTRQWVGGALIGIGARFQGTPARHIGDSTAT
jgi:hypothetical protein